MASYGSDHQRRRRAWADHLVNVGPVACRKCERLVYADPAMNFDGRGWQLGHGVAVKHGGTGEDSAPEHATCNEGDGYAISLSGALHVREW